MATTIVEGMGYDIQSFCSSAEFGAMIADKFDKRFKISMVDANQKRNSKSMRLNLK